MLEDDSGDMKRPNDTPSALDAAYRIAIYRIEAPGGAIELTVGARSAALDALLGALGGAEAALVSAANPGSRRLSPEENRERHDRLRERVEAGGWRSVAGGSAAPDGDWSEAQLLVIGISETEAVDLARDFGQAAIVVLAAGEPCRLRFV